MNLAAPPSRVKEGVFTPFSLSLREEREKRSERSRLIFFLATAQLPTSASVFFPSNFSSFFTLSLKYPLPFQIQRTGRGGTAACCTAMTHAARREEEGADGGGSVVAAAAVAVAVAAAAAVEAEEDVSRKEEEAEEA